MKDLSVIIPYCFARIDNLLQTVRLLPEGCSELILICNDKAPDDLLTKLGRAAKLQSLDMSDFSKSVLCNAGVKAATNEWVCLLDSDRILPSSFFKLIDPKVGECYTLRNVFQAFRNQTDEQLQGVRDKDKSWMQDNRSDSFIYQQRLGQYFPKGKNIFSGNLVISKTDYWKFGGMDEEFVGYGFADADATYRALQAGLKPVFFDGIELHLRHSYRALRNGTMALRDQTLIHNALQFHKKHNRKPEGFLHAAVKKYLAENPADKKAHAMFGELKW